MKQSIIRVRYQETDQMGVVYHGNYLTWFEVGRTDYIRSCGFTYQRLEKQGIWLPVVEVQARFLAPAQYDEELIIQTTLEELGSSKVVFTYEVTRKEDGHLLTKGYSKHLWTDKELKRVNLKRNYPQVYQRLKAQGQGQSG